MKIGDRIKVIYLEKDDEKDTNISLGITGTIINYEEYKPNDMYDFVDIKFDEHVTFINNGNVNEYGYRMYKYQLELLK